MKHLATSRHFQKQLKKLPQPDQQRALDTLKAFLHALRTKEIPAGLGFKKINHDKYEIRMDIRTRIVMKLDQDTFVCHFIGDHEKVRRYLKDYRNK